MLAIDTGANLGCSILQRLKSHRVLLIFENEQEPVELCTEGKVDLVIHLPFTSSNWLHLLISPSISWGTIIVTSTTMQILHFVHGTVALQC